MKKSPAKWIRGVLFGKKPSRGKNPLSAPIRAALPASEFPEPVISLPTVNAVVKVERELDTSNPVPAVEKVERDLESFNPVPAVVDDEAQRNLDASATTVQASFRGYLARRAFRTLKGIIRLQALIRGHLVRRQAVATLCCVYGIVKLQARFRGRKSRSQFEGIPHANAAPIHIPPVLLISKTTSNAFVRKILSSAPDVFPLKLQYDSQEPNSAPGWLNRWSSSCFWKPERTSAPSKTVKKQERPKRSVRRIPPNAGEQKRAAKSTPESPQSEFERVKRNLRKISSNAAQENSDPKVPEEDKAEAEREAELEPPRTEEAAAEAQAQVEEKKEEANGEVKSKEESEKPVRKTSSIPSYMLATESAKAKSRSSSLSHDASDKDNGSRRHSLPSANSKPSRGSLKRDGKGEWRR